ncbi:hypothetical protein GGR53DRAFT_72938 [Hypoxylon sp. FL1150]|nr:hypothetical protein GGR53DRAFT_72938 [Hypoxylon sp. FL1150]
MTREAFEAFCASLSLSCKKLLLLLSCMSYVAGLRCDPFLLLRWVRYPYLVPSWRSLSLVCDKPSCVITHTHTHTHTLSLSLSLSLGEGLVKSEKMQCNDSLIQCHSYPMRSVLRGHEMRQRDLPL